MQAKIKFSASDAVSNETLADGNYDLCVLLSLLILQGMSVTEPNAVNRLQNFVFNILIQIPSQGFIAWFIIQTVPKLAYLNYNYVFFKEGLLYLKSSSSDT
jgi:hypothetical protein